MPANANNWACAAAQHHHARLLDAGVRILEYPTMLHAKAFVRDGEELLAGTCNLEAWSLKRFFEIDVRIRSTALAAQFEERFSAPAEAVSSPGRALTGRRERARECSRSSRRCSDAWTTNRSARQRRCRRPKSTGRSSSCSGSLAPAMRRLSDQADLEERLLGCRLAPSDSPRRRSRRRRPSSRCRSARSRISGATRSVRPPAVDLDAIARLDELVQDVVGRRVDAERALAALDDIREHSLERPWPLLLAAYALAGAALTPVLAEVGQRFWRAGSSGSSSGASRCPHG